MEGVRKMGTQVAAMITMITKSILKLVSALATVCALSMCGTGYDRATLDTRPNEGAVAAEAAARSGSSPEGGSSSPSIGRVALPPEQPRR